MDMTCFPPGFRFKPTDKELIEYYLTRKVSGELVLPDCITILERQMFGNLLPWEILTEDDPWDYTWESSDDTVLKQKEIYVFSRLIQMGKKKRAVRTAGCGTWGGKQVSHDIRACGKVIGRTRSYTFSVKDESVGASKGRWRMHEYSIMDNTDLVLCRIIVDNLPRQETSIVVVDQLVGGKRKYEQVQTTDDCSHKRANIDADQEQELVYNMPEVIEQKAIPLGYVDDGTGLYGGYESVDVLTSDKKAMLDGYEYPRLEEYLNVEKFAAELVQKIAESDLSMIDEIVGLSVDGSVAGPSMTTYMEPFFQLNDFGGVECSGFVPQPVKHPIS